MKEKPTQVIHKFLCKISYTHLQFVSHTSVHDFDILKVS